MSGVGIDRRTIESMMEDAVWSLVEGQGHLRKREEVDGAQVHVVIRNCVKLESDGVSGVLMDRQTIENMMKDAVRSLVEGQWNLGKGKKVDGAKVDVVIR